MSSDDFRFQTQRIERLAAQECPAYMVIFPEQESAKIIFGLQHRVTGRRSGRSPASSASEVRDRDDARWKKLLRLMACQCER